MSLQIPRWLHAQGTLYPCTMPQVLFSVERRILYGRQQLKLTVLVSSFLLAPRNNTKSTIKIENVRYTEHTDIRLKKNWITIRFWELPTYPSLKPTLTLTSHLRQKCWLREGVGRQRIMIQEIHKSVFQTLLRLYYTYMSLQGLWQDF